MTAPSNTHAGLATPAAVPLPLWRIRLEAIAWFVLVAAFILGLPVLLGWATGCSSLWSRTLLGWTPILGALVAAPFYYLMVVTETRPAAVPQVSLANDSKRVVFQGMQHIGSERFYQAVIYDLEKALSEGDVSYYEGVQTSTPESKAFFEKLSQELVGGADLSGTDKSIGEVCGMKFQLDDFGLLDADKAEHPKRHLVADVDAIELKAEHERLMREDPGFARAHASDFQPKPATNDNAFMLAVVEWLKRGSASQKALGGVTCRGLFSLNQPTASTAPGRMERVNLDFRKLDPKWAVGSVKWLRTIEAPEHVEGQLSVETFRRIQR